MSFLRDSSSMLLWRGLSICIGAVTSTLLVRWLGPVDRGALTLVVLAVSLAAVVLQAGVPEALIYILGSERFPHEEVISSVLGYALMLITVSAVLTPLLPATWFGADAVMKLMAIIAIGSSVLVTILRHVLIAEKKFRQYTQSIMLEGMVYLSAIVLIRITIGLTVQVALAAYALSLTVVLGRLAWARTRNSGGAVNPLRIRWEIVRTCLGYGSHLFVTGLGGFAVQRINYVVLERVSGLAAVGRYTAASTLPSIFANLPQQLATVLYSHVAADKNSDRSSRLTVATFALLAAVCAVAIVFVGIWAEPIVEVLFGQSYAGIGPSLVILSVGTCCLGLASVLFNALAGRGEQRIGSYLTLVNVVCIAVLSYIMIPRWGLAGAATAYALTAAVNLACVAVVFCRLTRVRLSDFAVVPWQMFRDIQRSRRIIVVEREGE